LQKNVNKCNFLQLLAHVPVRLFDASKKMTDLAEKRRKTLPRDLKEKLKVRQLDYLAAPLPRAEAPADLTCLHGSAEWMSDSDAAIQKAADEAAPGSYLSLLVFNSDRQILKQGINGQLLPETRPGRRRKLTPPGGLSPRRIRDILEPEGTVLLQSGIRIFHDFFRQFDPGTLSEDQWLAQEMLWYRKEPFTGLGEHSHFIWQKREETLNDY
ncbi:MAG: hypothetical protein PQJ50_06315, partial [Spirochaetales bacterium]|nr:hypothetical protein [Spirochaetales bacterium]